MARYALIIGIAEYMGSFKSLETPVQNANAIAEILDRHGDFNQVKRLPFRREAGQKDLGTVIRKPLPHATLVQGLQQFLQDANGSDLLLYYSGHGFTKLDPLSNTPEGFLAPSDCQVELNAAGQIVAEKNGISLAGLNALINQHTFNSLVVILDCCNAGAFLETSMVRRDVTAFGYERDYYLITACRSSSKAYEGEEYSLLTDAVLKGLSQTNAAPESGRISGDRLFDVIGNELQNSRQEPIRMGWGRLITLVRYLQPPQSSESVTQSFNPANPYMGLKPFEREQAEYFFGREQAVRALLDRLAENRFLAVIGPSGCGKSSLVKAGLLPELERDRIPSSRDWQVEIITPGQYPLQALTNALEQHRSDAHPLVLFVDQFEELFTLCPNEEEQRTFIKRLDQETNDPDRQTRIVIALRGDFLDRCAKFQESADLINTTTPTTYIVTPLTEAKLVAELEESITCPAALHGVNFEQGLVARIVDDVVNQPGAMPLLQYALTQLWDTCISPNGVARLLTIQSYDSIEGVKGALQHWADQFYTNLSPKDQAFVQEMIGEMVQLGDEGEVTRRRAPWERLRELASSQEQLNRIIGRLVYQRLLVADDKTVEVAHEALLKESRLIQGWIEDNRESIRLQQRLAIYRREWEEHDRTEDYLLDAGRLAAIDEWSERKQPRLTNGDQAFIERSRERRDQQFQAQLQQERKLREEAERRAIAEFEKTLEAEARVQAETEKAEEVKARVRTEIRRRQMAIAAGLFAVSTMGLGILAQYRQAQIAEGNALTIGTLVGKAQQFLESGDQVAALATSLEALRKIKEIGKPNEDQLNTIHKILARISIRNSIKIYQGQLFSISSNLSGQYIVSGGSDGAIKIWDLEKKQLVSLPQKSKSSLAIVRFSHNGSLFASGNYDGSIGVWSIDKINPVNNFNSSNEIYDISFSHDNQYLATVGNSEKILIYNVGEINLAHTNPIVIWDKKYGDVKKYRIRGVDFHPINRSILVTSGYKNYDIAIWDLERIRDQPRRIGISKAVTQAVRFSKDGDMIVSCNNEGFINIRKLTGELIGRINTGEKYVYKVEWSLDSKLLASISVSGKIKLWSVEETLNKWSQRNRLKVNNKDNVTPLQEISSKGSITQVSFIEDSKIIPGSYVLASADTDGNISIWEIKKYRAVTFNPEQALKEGCNILTEYSKMNPDKVRKISGICPI